MNYVPVVINTEADMLAEAFGMSDERYNELTSAISKKLSWSSGEFSKASLCKLFVEGAESTEEAVMLAFTAGAFLADMTKRKLAL